MVILKHSICFGQKHKKIIFYRKSPMQTEKSQPEGKRILPETRFNQFPALSVDSWTEIFRSASETVY